ncbi:MAG: chemotaxis response regulator protein-glutamate methylesterase [Pirellulaceae bacterium]
MSSELIRVLVVDDSPLIREMISDFIREAPGMEVAGVAADGKAALAAFDRLRPDLVTLDVQMPVMDGLATLDALLARRPLPIIMVSGQTRLGADITLEALDRGALDYVAKPDGVRDAAALRDDLLRKIRSVSGTDVQRVMEIRRERAAQKQQRADDRKQRIAQKNLTAVPPAPRENQAVEYADKCIAIGISTGGPPALSGMFENLSGPLPPIVVVQHMPANFTGAFAARLNTISQLSIKEAETGDQLQPGCVYIAQGAKHLMIQRSGRTGRLLVKDGDPVSGHKPSADVMMTSAAEVFGPRCLGVIMTGMGRDGSDGCKAIREAGGYVLGQDEATSDVYGMNKVAFVEGNVDRQFGLEEAAGAITKQIKRMWSPIGSSA